MSAQLEKLRCTHCGAPLPQPRQGENFIKCEYCGFINKLADTSAYVERLKTEIMKWLTQILPAQTIVSTTADPLARHHIFRSYVKPNLIVVYTNAKTTYIQATHKSLIVFNPVYQAECTEQPRSLFERSMLVDGVSELAIADEDRSFLEETRRSLLVPAYICNALRDAAEEKYSESVKNLDEAISMVESSGDKALVQRLRIAKTVYTALGEIYSRNPITALNLLLDAERAISDLLSMRSESNISKYTSALEIELDLVKILRGIAEISRSSFEMGQDPLASFAYVKKVLNLVVSNIKAYNKSIKEITDVVEQSKKMIQSRLGAGKVRVIGDGELYIPFYIVSSNITYTTGLLLKKGNEIRVDLLVSASPPVFKSITDVFNAYSGRQLSIEKELDAARMVSTLIASARMDSLRTKAIPPLISPSIADGVADKYLDVVRHRYAGKIKLSTTHVGEIVYVGLKISSGYIQSPLPIHIFSVDWNKVNEIAF